jgi:hypothetical protein
MESTALRKWFYVYLVDVKILNIHGYACENASPTENSQNSTLTGVGDWNKIDVVSK